MPIIPIDIAPDVLHGHSSQYQHRIALRESVARANGFRRTVDDLRRSCRIAYGADISRSDDSGGVVKKLDNPLGTRATRCDDRRLLVRVVIDLGDDQQANLEDDPT